MTSASEVIVVGAGAAGASVAYELVKRGLSVTMIERDSIASHASGFAYGGLFPTMGAGIPGPILRHAKRGISLHKRLAPELEDATGIDIELRAVRSLDLALDEDGFRHLQESLAWQREEDLEADLLDADGVRSEEPSLTGELAGGLVQRSHFEVDSYKYTLALVTAFERAGGTHRPGDVVGLARDGDRVTGAMLSNGEEIPGGSVVLATGPWSGDGAEGLPHFPVKPKKGEILRLRFPGRDFVHRISLGGHYIARKPDGLVWVGTTEEDAGFDDRPSTAARDSIMTGTLALAPALESAEIVQHTACLRPVTSDEMPILGALPGHDGLFAANGAGKKGILLSPVMGRMVAGAITGDAGRDPIPTEFDAARFSYA
ncbi:MAG: FAD-dependent oxidoreductase [Dehalococcoidia bacterium]|nr:FAD-dependent oxidoreductase [Dehalococcoidia bacterium]